jgi:hypothetical protein
MTSKPTKLDDARELKRAGLPLNTPLEHRTFSQEYSEHWFRLLITLREFMVAAGKFCDGPRGNAGRWNSLKRRFGGFRNALRDCDESIGKLSGNVTPPAFKSEQDEQECRILSDFLLNRATPYVTFWQNVTETVDGGVSQRIEPGDIPKWLDCS